MEKFMQTYIAVDDQVDRLIITVTSSDEDTDTASDSYDDERTDTASEGHEASWDLIVMSFCYFVHCESNWNKKINRKKKTKTTQKYILLAKNLAYSRF